MKNLQCKQINSEELIKCVFGLKKTELNIFLFLLKKKKGIASNELANKLGLDRTTIQKAMKNLLEKNIVVRRQLNLDNGGYTFVYIVNEKEKIQELLTKTILDWKELAEKQLEALFLEEAL
jgi:predicted transcriptional regulator